MEAKTLEYLLSHCRKTPWRVGSNPNGPPFIVDCDGNVITQMYGTLDYSSIGTYSNKNQQHADLICYAVNNLKK